MNIKIIAVGKIKEKFTKLALEEYDDDAYDGDCLSFDAEGEEDCGTDMGYADDENYAE